MHFSLSHVMHMSLLFLGVYVVLCGCWREAYKPVLWPFSATLLLLGHHRSSCWNFLCLCSHNSSVIAANLLCTVLSQDCIIFIFCTSVYTVGCVAITVTMLLHFFEDSHQWFAISNYADLIGETVMMNIYSLWSMPSASFFSFLMLLYLVSLFNKLLLAKAMRYNAVLSGASSYGEFLPPLICSSPAPRPLLDKSVSIYRSSLSLKNSNMLLS